MIWDDFEFVENGRFDGKRATKKTRYAYDYWSNGLGDIERAIWKKKTHDNSHCVLMVHIYNLLGTSGLLIVNFIILTLNIS